VELHETLARAQCLLGHTFNDPGLLRTALTHSSVANSRVESNERLEFLGDSVLGMVVCTELYHRFCHWLEGDLTKVKSVVVSRRVCAEIADKIGLTQLLILGNGVGVRHDLPNSLRAAVYEAVIGAMYLDGGLEPAREFIRRTVSEYLDPLADSQTHENYKSALQQYAQRHLNATPAYEALDEQGPDHSKCFEICVVIGGERFPSAWGPTKKQAEQSAARNALNALRECASSRSGTYS
jgi:ribonuclease-3